MSRASDPVSYRLVLAVAGALVVAPGCAPPGQRGVIHVDQGGVDQRLQTMCIVRGGEDAQCRARVTSSATAEPARPW